MVTKQQMRKRAKQATILLDRWFDYQVKSNQVPGMAVGIVHDGDVIYRGAFGLADIRAKKPTTTQTCYHIASISKTFTATAIMQLVEHKQLRLADKVSKHLPWLLKAADQNLTTITIRQLLTHTAGVSRDGDLPQWVDDNFPTADHVKEFFLKQEATFFKPGKQFKYSNYGYGLLGLVIEAVSGANYEDYLKQHIFKPLGLRHTSVEAQSNTKKLIARGYGKQRPGEQREVMGDIVTRGLAPAAGLVSNVDDLCRYLTAQLMGSKQLLTDQSKRAMQRIQHNRGKHEKLHYGLGYDIWQDGTHRQFGHGGGFSGQTTNIRMEPATKLGVVLLSNSIDGLPWQLAGGVYATLHHFIEQGGTLRNGKKLTGAGRYTGRFRWRGSDVEVVAIAGRLIAFFPDSRTPALNLVRLTPTGRNEFRIEGGSNFDCIGETVRYVFDRRGQVKTFFWGPEPLDKLS